MAPNDAPSGLDLEEFPYGARVTFATSRAVQLALENATTIARLEGPQISMTPTPWLDDKARGVRVYRASTAGFRSTEAAEQDGLRLAFALTWASVSFAFPLRFIQASVPYEIFDRREMPGQESHGRAHQTRPLGLDQLSQLVQEGYVAQAATLPRIRLALELMAMSSFDATPETKLLTLVSVLECLSDPQPLSKSWQGWIDSLVDGVRAVEHPEGTDEELMDREQNSLTNRIRLLKKESIRQAIRRVVNETFPGHPEVGDIIEEAYTCRSQILHRGRTEMPVGQIGNRLFRVLRLMLAKNVGKDLALATTIS